LHRNLRRMTVEPEPVGGGAAGRGGREECGELVVACTRSGGGAERERQNADAEDE
jgi:hypothetical protein